MIDCVKTTWSQFALLLFSFWKEMWVSVLIATSVNNHCKMVVVGLRLTLVPRNEGA